MIGIIAGSGLQRLNHLEHIRREIVRTPFGETSCALTMGQLAGKDIVFINRHGYGHTLAPHQINYRANIWALQKVGVTSVCAIGSVGALTHDLTPGQLVIPTDFLDYTQGRINTFFEGPERPIVYTDMSQPFDHALREQLAAAAQSAGVALHTEAVYACTNGPRLETPAEVRRMRQDGGSVVGMTLIPEVILAKELALPYAAVTVCTNYAAGVRDTSEQNVQHWRALREQSLSHVEQLLLAWMVL